MDQTLIQTLLDRFSCPLYVFEETLLEERIRLLKNALPEDVKLCYAVKANPFIARFLEEKVDRFEICSPGEMYICEMQKVPAGKFVLSGVYKDEPSMRYAFENGLCSGILTAESPAQFELLFRLAREYNQPLRLLLRLTSGNQFGMEEEDILRLMRRCTEPGSEESRYMTIAGIQFFSGTQKTSLKKTRREFAMLDDFLDRIREETGTGAGELEYGPGFPAAYFEGETFDEEAYLKEFRELLEGMRNRLPVTLELGRGIAASCGSLLSRVVDVKCCHHENYAILDSGIHHLTYYGQFMAMKQPLCELYPPRERAEETEGAEAAEGDAGSGTAAGDAGSEAAAGAENVWTLCGSLCTINDLLVKRMPIDRLSVGDVVIFHNTGAYSMTEGISLFLSRDLPAVVWVQKDGQIQLLREAEHTWKLNAGMAGGSVQPQ